MPDLGRQVIASCLKDSAALGMFVEAGFDLAWMTDKQDLSRASIFGGDVDTDAYMKLLEYWQRNQEPPGMAWFRNEFPADSFPLPVAVPPADELLRQVEENRLRIRLEVLYAEFADLHAAGDYEGALRLIASRSQQLASTSSSTVRRLWVDTGEDLAHTLERTEELGVRAGIDELDKHFAGWQPGQLVTFLGRAKAAKTSHLIKSALAAHQDGRRVLFVSVEITAESILDRCRAFAAGVEYEMYVRGRLTDSQKQKILGLAETFGADEAFEIAQPQSRYTVDDLDAEISRVRPDVVYIDGFYFLVDRNTGKPGAQWEGHDNLARELKELALRRQVTIITTMQIREKQAAGGRRGGGFDDNTMMGGTGLLMASDMVLTMDMDDAFVNTISCSRSRTRYLPRVRGRWDWSKSAFELLDDDGYADEDS